MVDLFLPFLGLFAGLTVGYCGLGKRSVPSLKFVRKGEKETTLRDYNITIDESTKCSVCSEEITVDNLGMVVPAADKSIFICSKQHCMISQNIFTIPTVVWKTS